ncbi:MAG: hypothetical protein IPN76_35485 [Saprospiraceae bacterium]|nr:hypothetical protein [Saprospiraceae bacterium]
MQPGESKLVSFSITPELLKFYNCDLKYDWELGSSTSEIGTAQAS